MQNCLCYVLEEMMKNSPEEIQQQMADNIQWIKGAQENKLVVGSQARILYADAEGSMTKLPKPSIKAIPEKRNRFSSFRSRSS